MIESTSPTQTLAATDDAVSASPAVPALLECLTEMDELAALKEDWNRLVTDQTPAFQTFGWNWSWFANYSDRYEEMAVFVLKQGTEVLAILPCYRSKYRLRLAGDNICDFQDLISSSEKDALALVDELFQFTKEHCYHFHFHMLAENGVLLPILRAKTKAAGFATYEKSHGPCPWFRLAENGEAFLAGKAKAKLRKRTRRALRRLEDLAPGHTYRIIEDEQITEAVIADVRALHSGNQHRKAGPSIFDSNNYRSFLGDAAASGDVGIRVIEVRNQANELIAFDLGFQRGERFYAYLGAYDDPYAGGSPGMCLLHWQMDELPARGVTQYDFLCGNEAYKRDYATEHYGVVMLQVYTCSFRNKILTWTKQNLLSLKRAVKPAFIALGLLPKV